MSLTGFADEDLRDVKIQEEVRREVLSFLEIDWLAGHQRSKEALQYQQQRLNTLPCLDVVLKSFGCDHSSKTTDLTSIKFLCTVITRVQLLFAVTMSSTLDQNTSTYVTISSESKWKIEWLNSTSWKRTINLQTFSQKHYQENVKNGDGRAVQLKFSSQSTTTALSIENGSLFEGESECENLLHHTSVSCKDFHQTRNTMAEQNVPTQPPTRIDEQIVPRSQCNTNFFRAFTASASVPAIYMQQLSNTMKYDEKTRVYSCQVDEQWFDLSANLLKKALAITPVIPAQSFELPPSGNTVIDFVNELGYPEPVEIVSNIRVNYVYQPWRAILTLINQCLTGKTSGFWQDKPRHLILQMLWGMTLKLMLNNSRAVMEEVYSRDPEKHFLTQGRVTKPGEGEGANADMERAIKLSLDPAFMPQGRAPVGGVMIRDPYQGQARSDPEKAHEAKAGPDLEPMQEDQTGSDSVKLHVSLARPNPEHMDDEFLATAYPKVHENLKLIIDERVIEDNPESYSGSMSSMKDLEDTDNFGDQFLYDKPTEDDQEKSKIVEESDSTIPDPSHQTVTSTPPVIALVTDFSSPKPSLLLRVARLEQEMSKVKKTDHSADVLASIKFQVPTVFDKYLGTKLDDALLRILERYTADLIEKYSVLPGQESVKNQEFEKSPKDIIRIKKEQDEDAMDKEVKDRVKNHKRKHDSDDDEDDEGPSARSNQGKSAKRRRHDSEPEKNLGKCIRHNVFMFPPENELQRKDVYIGSSSNGSSQMNRKEKLYKADLEGPSFQPCQSLS
ncbi:hypothetical protein Tco_0012377 [Tanacetum coccineum]